MQELTTADEALARRVWPPPAKALAESREERDRLDQSREEAAQRAADLRAQRSGLASRIEVLEGLERSREGFGVGAREVFALMEQAEPGPWRTIAGIVADFLTVRREYAPLIDLALGERAQRFLVHDPELLAQGVAPTGAAVFQPRQLPAALVAKPQSRAVEETRVTWGRQTGLSRRGRVDAGGTGGALRRPALRGLAGAFVGRHADRARPRGRAGRGGAGRRYVAA